MKKIRICKKCNKGKEENRNNFYRKFKGSDKFRSICKECASNGKAKKRNKPEDILNRYTIDDKGCWIYTKSKDRLGYGIFYIQQTAYKAHRVSYELKYGQIKKGLVIDHLCKKRDCINPEHLEAVTQAENVRRTWLPPHCKTCLCKEGDQNSII